jgi:pseudouridine-5'-phosphate glycosidase/pseudouridine kinase
MVFGSAAVDITAQSALPSDRSAQSTSPGSVSLSLGGVGRNIAEAAHRILSPVHGSQDAVQLGSTVGDDAFGRLLKEEMARMSMRLDGLVDVDARTAVCNLVLDAEGALVSGVADMGIVEQVDGIRVNTHFSPSGEHDSRMHPDCEEHRRMQAHTRSSGR